MNNNYTMHIGFSDTYSKARLKLKEAEVLSEVNSDTDCQENLKRSRKHRARVDRSSSRSSESDEQSDTVHTVKVPPFPQMPTKDFGSVSNKTQS